MELHRRLTYIGAVLLVATFVMNSQHEGDGFNYAYVTGVGMIAAFGLSLVLFTKDKIRPSDL